MMIFITGGGGGVSIGPVRGTMFGRLSALLLLEAGSSGMRAAASATSLFCSLRLMACQVAWLNQNRGEAAKPDRSVFISG